MPTPDALDRVAELPAGSTVTVTASPRRGSEATVELVEQLAARGFAAVPHLAARRISDESELNAILARLHAAGVRDLFVVGGDSPAPSGDFADGAALLKAIDAAGFGFERIGVPSYPEGHPHVDDDALWDALLVKQGYATYTVTQMCLDATVVGQFISAARRRGVTLPVIAGVPGPVPPATLLRMGLRIGVGDSLKFARGHRKLARAFLRPSGYRPDALPLALAAIPSPGPIAPGPAGLHIYTFNETAAAAQWVDHLRRTVVQSAPQSAPHRREGRT
ncbi:methylenetetrahydrofolate reductase [Phytoactinopolyspora alkaliphila]|uniref:Methylenetetrahydrofolate reductase n=2 Tax=Phytoactinopolyspora alkaliphila TaxID=1783498 RepID=A0A6N9YGF6_9ACTN|nr:methylenetetrahydrofolate reductase [Phytoactinopolyspora alkaliphila]NED94141.1 methylenetetrahydrofolate reductase [Phytoactinopolyspora alkaliphila]